MASQLTRNLKKITYTNFGFEEFLFQMLYAWVCFIYGMHELHEFRSEMYHT